MQMQTLPAVDGVPVGYISVEVRLSWVAQV